mmetsp:Transcript_7592/g.15809  ORF Transcript_7592/g.15809 Transcript_7592/m.15809 type:complete len:270 (+) Transcript_7592:105-914(+)
MQGQGSPEPYVMMSANFWTALFDIIFFSVFAIGWLITYAANEPLIHDNPVQRAFQGNNICIGIDWGAANVAAVALIGVALYPITMFTQTTMYKMHQFQERGAWYVFHMVLLILGYITTCMFLLAPGTRPQFDDPSTVYLHVSGFALGCFGYSFLRGAYAMTFWSQYPEKWSDRYKAYFGLLVFSAFWIGLNGLIIVNYMLTEDIPELLSTPYDGHSSIMGGLFAGPIPTWQTLWTLTAAVQPFLRIIVAPPDLDRLQITPANAGWNTIE